VTLVSHFKGRTYEDKVLKRIFRPKREEVRGGWRKLQSFMICTLQKTISG
jgi:hypothetical protein